MMQREIGGPNDAQKTTGDSAHIEATMRPSLIALTALLLSISWPASHATPLEDSYIAARDGYIAKFEKYDEDAKKDQLYQRLAKGDPDAKAEADRISKELERALADLKGVLQRIVTPPPIIKEFSKARINLDSLSQGVYWFRHGGRTCLSKRKNKHEPLRNDRTPPAALDQ
jgi:predicted NBD/HSP70 family sugar kinase